MTGPATAIALAIGALVILGYIRVVISTTHPIAMTTTGGSADSMVLALGTVGSIVTQDNAKSADRSAAMVRLRQSELNDLCLVPSVDVPFIAKRLSLRLASSDPVSLDDVSLAATDGRVQGLDTPTTQVGSAGEGRGIAGTPGGFTAWVDSGPDNVGLGSTDVQAYGIVMDGGLSLSSLSVRPSFGSLAC